MIGFRISIAMLAALAVAAPAVNAAPLPVEGGNSDWVKPRVLVNRSAASLYTPAAVAAMGARARAAAAYYGKQKQATSLSFAELAALVRQYQPATKHAPTRAGARVRPYGAADMPGNSEVALDDLYGFGLAAPTATEPTPAAQLSDDEADAARSQLTRVNDEPVIDAFDNRDDMAPTGTNRSPAAQRHDDLDAALAAYEEGVNEPWLRRILGLPEAAQTRMSCVSVEVQPTPSSQAADPESEAYAAAKEAFDSGAVDPMLRDVLGTSGFGRHVLLVHTDDQCSTTSAFDRSAPTAGAWAGQTNTSSGYSPGVAADGLASLYDAGVGPVA